MHDVRNLQAMLSEGITDPALLYRQLEAGPFEVPDDGKEHSCPCGSSGYSTWDCDGWAKTLWKVDAIVVDDEGRAAPHCHRCDRELVAAKPKEKP